MVCPSRESESSGQENLCFKWVKIDFMHPKILKLLTQIKGNLIFAIFSL